MKRLCVALCLVLTACLSSRAAAPVITEIVAFGDSLSDNGNFSPYPPPFPGTTAYPKQTWVKQLAGKLNIKVFEPTGNGPAPAGTNYAFGGAATKYSVDKGYGYGAPFNQHNLTAQISGHYLNRTYNTAGARTGADVLHTITIGGNDLLGASGQPAMFMAGWDGLDAIAVNVAKSVEGQILALGKAGVKQVLWVSLPDYSTTPFAKFVAEKFGDLAPLYLTALQSAAVAYNDEMDKAIVRLKANPACAGLKIVKFDTWASMKKVQADPAAYGFKNITDKLTAIPYLKLGGGNPDGKVDEYFFLDEIHPTFKAHGLLADEALKALSAP